MNASPRERDPVGIGALRMKTEEAGVEPTEDAEAPSNGFEARAPHRERYSSAPEDAPVLRDTEALRFG